MDSKSQGQGHETTFRQVACERLGLAPEDFGYVEGDTDAVARGTGTFGSRSGALGGSALLLAGDKIIARGKPVAAQLLEAAEADVVFAQGRYHIAGTDRSVGLKDVAVAAGGMDENASFAPSAETFPNGCHVCEVEIDPDTGSIEVARYAVVDDVGTVINPLTVAGQVHGGIVQGLGQILMEQIVYDAESAQLLTASFMDYAMPRATDLCELKVEEHPVPTTLNPLGVKGVGEAGAVGALAAAMNAIVDALAPLGVRSLEMPATPERVWRALRAAGK